MDHANERRWAFIMLYKLVLAVESVDEPKNVSSHLKDTKHYFPWVTPVFRVFAKWLGEVFFSVFQNGVSGRYLGVNVPGLSPLNENTKLTANYVLSFCSFSIAMGTGGCTTITWNRQSNLVMFKILTHPRKRRSDNNLFNAHGTNTYRSAPLFQKSSNVPYTNFCRLGETTCCWPAWSAF